MYVSNPAVFGLPPVRKTPNPAPGNRTAAALGGMFAAYFAHPETAGSLGEWLEVCDEHLQGAPDAVVQEVAAAVVGETISHMVQEFTARIRGRIAQGSPHHGR